MSSYDLPKSVEYYSCDDIPYPERPTKKPVLKSKATPDEIREYAGLVEKYNSEMETYTNARIEYSKTIQERVDELSRDLQAAYNLNEKQASIVWKNAWLSGSFNGIYSVIDYYEEYVSMCLDFHYAT